VKWVIKGFKKIDTDKWKFANEGFQRGKRHLLKNIKRRSRFSKQQQGVETSVNLTKPAGLESDELVSLKKDHNVLKVEILKLRQQQEESQNQITAVEDRIRGAECRQQQMLLFLTKVAKSPSCVQQLIQKRKQKRELDGVEFGKRRRLLAPQLGRESLPHEPIDTSKSVNCRNQPQGDVTISLSELSGILQEAADIRLIHTPFPAPMDDVLCSPLQDRKVNVLSDHASTSPDMSSVYHVMSEKLLADNSIIDEELAVNDSKFYSELEDLIAKPPDYWGGFVSGLVEPSGCIGAML
jgi:heat shock transcription factor